MVDTTNEDGRVYNFSPGPCCLPTEVLKQAQKEMLNWNGTGVGVMELSHRSKEFQQIAEKARADLKTLIEVPDNFTIFFLQGGASMQYSATCYNLLEDKEGQVANFLITGYWGEQAIDEGQKFCTAHEVSNNKSNGYTTVADPSEWNIHPDAKFFHYCDNETIHGVEFNEFPVESVPENQVLVSDMSSNFCSKRIDWKRHGVVFAGAHKNLGPAGVCIAVIRNDLIPGHLKQTPLLCDWELYAKAQNTFHNTPPCYSIYLLGLVAEHTLKNGGLDAMIENAKIRSEMLYSYIDGSNGYYINTVDPKYRSRMNIPFRIANNVELETKFGEEAEKKGLRSLAGHVLVGACRASMYNAMPVEGIKALLEFMEEFKNANPINQ